MRVQILIFVFCAVAHGAHRKIRNLQEALGGGHPPSAPSHSYGAPPSLPPPPPPPSQSYFAPQETSPAHQSPPPAPSPSYSAPTPEVIPEQPPALYSPPEISAQTHSPQPEFVPSQPLPIYNAPPAPVQEYAPPAPIQPVPDYAPPAPIPAPAPSYGAPSAPSQGVSIDQEVNLSSAQAITGQTLIDGRIQSILSEEVRPHVSAAETSSQQGYSYNAPAQSCLAGETLNSNGVCERVSEITRYYLFDVPEAPKQPLPPTQTVEKKIHYNVLFLRVPTQSQAIQNTNLSQDVQKTLVYVVRDPPKESETIPAPVTEAYKPEAPEVFYVTPEAKPIVNVGYDTPVDVPSTPTQGYSYNPPSFG